MWQDIYPFGKFIDPDSHWYTWRVKEAIHIRFHPDNINSQIVELKFRNQKAQQPVSYNADLCEQHHKVGIIMRIAKYQ